MYYSKCNTDEDPGAQIKKKKSPLIPFCFLCKGQSMDYTVYLCILCSSYKQKLIYSSLGHSHVKVCACSLYHLKEVQPAASNMTTNEQSLFPHHAALYYLHKLRWLWW